MPPIPELATQGQLCAPVPFRTRSLPPTLPVCQKQEDGREDAPWSTPAAAPGMPGISVTLLTRK